LALGLLVGVTVFWLAYLAAIFLPYSLPNFLLAFVISAAVVAALSALLGLFLRLLGRAPWPVLWLLAALPVLFVPVVISELALTVGLVASLAFLIIVSALLGVGIGLLTRRSPTTRALRTVAAIMVALALVLGAAGVRWLLADGTGTPYPENVAARSASPLESLADDPGAPGVFSSTLLDYGVEPPRLEGRDARVAFIDSRTVDARAWVSNWSASRARYWGFGAEALPLSGRVWRPHGTGPFPLVLILHGNHRMEERSDLGYAYLCELLASRGMMCSTVDENFLNASTAAGGAYILDPGASIEVRAWLLLEHLAVWRAWNREPGHPFFQLIDEQRIALVGHSVGGEAVAVAAALCRLPAHPDDASRTLDYDFNIRSLVTIAPTDGLQELAGRPVRLENVDLLTIHGSHDMDVMAFQGQGQMERIEWTDNRPRFAAAVYVYGANHGQFNAAWGRRDKTDFMFNLMNTAQLMPGEEQRRITQTLVSAFLEAVLNGRVDYLNLLRDFRTRPASAASEAIVLSQVHESRATYVATYEEDIDLTSTTVAGGSIRGQYLAGWHEALAPLKLASVDTGVAHIAWDRSHTDAVPGYAIELPPSLSFSDRHTLVFALAHRQENDRQGRTFSVEPIDLTIEITDRAGQSAELPLSHFALLQPEPHVQLAKLGWMTSTVPASHPVFQTFSFPLADFVALNPQLDVGHLATVRLVFDRTPAGLILLDEVGFRP
jgi:dienelactone hydrolase